MNGKKLLTALAVSAVLFAGCGLKSREAIIKVNDTAITQAQFDKMFKQQTQNNMFAKLGMKITKEDNGFMYYLIQDRVINELIVNALLEQEMAKRGIEVSQEEIDKAIESMIKQVGGKQELSKILKQHGLTHNEFKANVKKELRMKKLAKETGKIEVSEAEMKKFYKENLDKFKYPDRVRASHILIEADEQAIRAELRSKNKNMESAEVEAKVKEQVKAAETKANELLTKVKANPADFAKLAKENSQDKTTAINGGDLGFFAAEEMVPEFSKAAFALKPNKITDKPVKTKYGYHIIMATDKMAASQQPYEKVQASLKSYLENQKQVEALDKLTESLKKQAKIEYLNPEYDPKEVQKGIDKEVEAAPKKIDEAKKKAEEAAKKVKEAKKAEPAKK